MSIEIYNTEIGIGLTFTFIAFIIFIGEMNIDSICIYRFYSSDIREEENMLNDLEVSKHHSWFSHIMYV